ncbi:unnamed protein product [Prunus brigantina]
MDHMIFDPGQLISRKSSTPSVVSNANGTPSPVDILTRKSIDCGTRQGKLYYLDWAPDSEAKIGQAFTTIGARWFVSFIDDCTRMTWVSLLKTKGEVSSRFQQFYQMVETQFHVRIQQLADISVPKSVTEALEEPKWKEAMNEEMRALQKNVTWELVPLPHGKKTIGCG